MSLLFFSTDEKMNMISDKVMERHFELDPKLRLEYNDRRRRLMYEDILYNLESLGVATKFNDKKIFTDYAVWVYVLLCYIMKDLGPDRVKVHMKDHYKILINVLKEYMSESDFKLAEEFLNAAIVATEFTDINEPSNMLFESGKYIDEKVNYLKFLLSNNYREASLIIESMIDAGVPIEDIYVDVIQEVMYEVGNLWHKSIITVDREHYCTSATQRILSQFYPIIFGTPKNDLSVLSSCVGSELHEMGVRMLSDLFEYEGWDSIYLGAAVPKQFIIKSIAESDPELIVLSVTMPSHLALCHEIVNEIRDKFPGKKIAVGGRAFQLTDKLWEKWDVDIYTIDARDLIKWAKENFKQ